jgi:hypothetical protein
MYPAKLTFPHFKKNCLRTHAQKYFQKLAKARQNGEEGDVTMEGRGGVSSAASVSTIVAAQTNKRRRPQPVTGTKRKVIQSIVISAQRQGKKMALEQQAAEAVIADESAEGGDGVSSPPVLIPPPLPTVTPILAHFILPNASASHDGAGSSNNNNGSGNHKSTSNSCVPSISTSQGTISGPALEDSMYVIMVFMFIIVCSCFAFSNPLTVTDFSLFCVVCA